MNSQERHEARYQRRKARREQRAREAGGASFEEVMSFGNICKAGKSCCDGARWKTSTINFETNLLGEAQATYDTLHYGKRVFKGFHSFATVEHGKVRNIDALPIQERAIQKCLCKNFFRIQTHKKDFRLIGYFCSRNIFSKCIHFIQWTLRCIKLC